MQENNQKFNDLIEGEETLRGFDLKGYLLEGLSNVLNKATSIERDLYLNDHPNDSGNGFSPKRDIKMGTSPISTLVPRTRSGDFYPSLLTKYERTLPEDYEFILRKLLLNSKSFSAVKRTIQSLNLPYRPDQLDLIISEIYDEAKVFYSRRLSPDWYFIYIDAKCIDLINENNKLDKAVVFTVVGVTTECKKEIVSLQLFWGNESVDLWKKVLIDIKNRGLTRALMLITDDFSGLTSVIKSLFPNSNHQLCHVHLYRNALRHLSKTEYVDFKLKIEDSCSSPDFETARSLFLELVSTLKPNYPDYAKHLHSRADQYSVFAKFPRDLRPHIRSTNPVEGINNHIEIIQRTSGGLFHSERELFVKLKLMADSLHSRNWKVPTPKIKAHIHELSRIFFMTFETDSV